MRFDFHWTTIGWQISEVNSDVPGGFTEAASFSGAMAAHFPETAVTGNPATAWIQALAEAAGGAGAIALIAAPGYMEDQQVAAYLGRRLQGLGISAPVVEPRLIHWDGGRATINAPWFRGELNGIVRFYQGEWLSNLPRRVGWTHFFGRKSRIPVTNPGRAILSESKRLPLVWKALGLGMTAWQTLLPDS